MMPPDQPRHAATEGRRRIDAVALILGDQAASDGPWSLLGIPRGESSDQRIAAALEARLLQINRHTLGGIPEADDVRLALHAAAAQVLNTHVRERLLSDRRDGAGPPSPGGHASFDPFLHAIAMHGGVNERSIRRIMLLTPGIGGRHLIASEIKERLVAWSHRRTDAAARPSVDGDPVRFPGPAGRVIPPPFQPDTAPVTDQEVREHEDPGARALRSIVVVAASIIAAAAVVVIGVLALLRPPGTPEDWIPKTDPAAQAPIRPTEIFASDVPRKAAGRSATPEPTATDTGSPGSVDPVSMVRTLSAAASTVQDAGEESLARFNPAVRLVSSRWHLLPVDQLGACQDAIVEFLYRAPSVEIARLALEATLDAANAEPWSDEAVLTDVWRAGIQARLARERDLAAPVRELIDSTHATPHGRSTPQAGSFSRGALDRLASIPALLAAQSSPESSPESSRRLTAAWSAWRGACRLLTGADEAAFDRLMITGLDAILESSPVPATSRGLGDVLRDLVLAVSWRSGSAARTWFISLFSSPSVQDADLGVITRTLATESAADGVTPTMIHASHADDQARSALRDAYSAAWGLSDPGRRDLLIEKWIARAEAGAAPLSVDRRSDEHHAMSLEQALNRGKINLAAAMIWAGLFDDADAILSQSSSAIALSPATTGNAWSLRGLDDGASDGSWAVKYLAAEHRVPQRLALLAELKASDRPIGQMDAEVLVADAIRGTPESVRNAARDALDRWVTTTPALYALLEESFRIPRTRQNATLISSITLVRLPPPHDPTWYAHVRRALVDRLLESLSAAGPLRSIDLLSDHLAMTCAARAKPSDAARSSGAATLDRPAAALTPQAAIDDLLSVWRRSADSLLPTARVPLTRELVERRLAARSSAASGPVQRFAATHLAVAELMAVVVAGDRPSRTGDIRAILEQLATQRRDATHVFDQINASELAMMNLWRIRLEGGHS